MSHIPVNSNNLQLIESFNPVKKCKFRYGNPILYKYMLQVYIIYQILYDKIPPLTLFDSISKSLFI
jgi:hypothetical protein